MTDEEFRDDELRAGLTSLSPSLPDVDAALHQLRPRARRARARRRAAVAGASAAIVLVVVSAALLVPDDNGDEDLDAAFTDSTTTIEPSTTSTTPTTTTSTTNTTPTTEPVVPATSPPDGTTPTPSTETTPTTTAADVEEQTFAGNLGAITVRRTGNTLLLLSENPEPGATVTDEEEQPDRIRVDFEPVQDSGGARTRIEVNLENGRMVPRIDENS